MSTEAVGGEDEKKKSGFSAMKWGGGAECVMRTVCRGEPGPRGRGFNRIEGEHGEVASVEYEAGFEPPEVSEEEDDSGDAIPDWRAGELGGVRLSA